MRIVNSLLQYTFENYILPWYESTYYKRSDERDRRDEAAANVEKALANTIWVPNEAPNEELSGLGSQIAAVGAESLDNGSYSLRVYLMDTGDPMLSDGSFELSDFLRNFKPLRDLVFSDFNS
jgi:hypothetical protein